ncbi:uncharacterized protein LOC132272393 [Cornus florida]|uniref:uncharacterized protein LOC132272393 n=1 Tax=Cornus florida TaxID=4283 RepID=UPI00289AF213|nr:uncharacterized protein LOC132272393 [Cornus florida]
MNPPIAPQPERPNDPTNPPVAPRPERPNDPTDPPIAPRPKRSNDPMDPPVVPRPETAEGDPGYGGKPTERMLKSLVGTPEHRGKSFREKITNSRESHASQGHTGKVVSGNQSKETLSASSTYQTTNGSKGPK